MFQCSHSDWFQIQSSCLSLDCKQFLMGLIVDMGRRLVSRWVKLTDSWNLWSRFYGPDLKRWKRQNQGHPRSGHRWQWVPREQRWAKGRVEMKILGVPLGNQNGGGDGEYRLPTWVPTKYGGCGVVEKKRLWLVGSLKELKWVGSLER